MVYDEVECTMILVHRTVDPAFAESAAANDPDESHYWVCQDDNMMAYRVALSTVMAAKADLVSGVTRIAVSKAILTEGDQTVEPQLLLSPDAAIVRSDDDPTNRRRRLVPKTGTRSVLVVRCASADGTPTLSVADSVVNLFGGLIPGRSDAANLASQMNACSKGALNFQPATGGNGAIQNGGIDVKIAQSTNGVKGGTVQNWCVNKVQETVGLVSQWDHIYVILPGNGAFLAFTM
jgi:hypothetical protein